MIPFENDKYSLEQVENDELWIPREYEREGVPRIEWRDFERLFALLGHSDSFDEYKVGDFTTRRKKIEETNINRGLGSAVFDCDPFLIMSLMTNYDIRNRWDWGVSIIEIVEEFANSSEVTYTCSKSLPFTSMRDFVQVRRLIVEEDYCVVVFRSSMHPDRPEVRGKIRGTVPFSGMIARRVENTKTEFTMVTNTDAGRGIPEWLVNKIMGLLIRFGLRNIRNSLVRYYDDIMPMKEAAMEKYSLKRFKEETEAYERELMKKTS